MWWSRFKPTLVHEECVVDKVALRQIYLHTVQFFPVSYSTISAPYSFIYHLWLVQQDHYYLQCGLGSSVRIATGYRLDHPGIESRWGCNFSHTSRPALGPTQPAVQCVPGLSQEVKQPGRGADHPLPSSAEVTKG
jgi:hypothetical protein